MQMTNRKSGVELVLSQMANHASLPLYDAVASRQIEHHLASPLPTHTLMRRAGMSIARLALALWPHAQTIWVACGPGNNGGDGFEAALHLHSWGKTVVLTWLGTVDASPPDALLSRQRALDAGICVTPNMPAHFDVCIDALWGLGRTGRACGRQSDLIPPQEIALADWVNRMNACPERILAVDLPSGLNPDTGQAGPNCVTAHATLCLLTLKPGLFTAGGRDACGQIWLDRLEGSLDASLGGATAVAQPTAWLAGAPSIKRRRHASHKGSYGDVAVMGGAPGMTGAALLAATAALQCGAGRVFVALLDAVGLAVDTQHPELMFRPAETLDLSGKVVVLGCGGSERIKPHINRVLEALVPVVIDADAINSIATDRQLQMQLQVRADRNLDTVLTPHPLEAARLLGWTTAQVQEDRLKAAATLANQFLCTVVLKGSGTVITRPGVAPTINPTGNAALATAGTGDVLAGMIGAALAQSWPSRIDGEPTGSDAFNCACAAVYLHGQWADAWLANNVNNPQLTGSAKLTASQLVHWLNPGLQMASW